MLRLIRVFAGHNGHFIGFVMLPVKFCLVKQSLSPFQDLYHKDHPRGINPVQLNDVIFTLHAIVITLLTISQCFIYEVRCLVFIFIY